MPSPSVNPNGQLLLFFKDWQQAISRLQMAQQTLGGAQVDLLAKEARFKGAAELLYGTDATFEYNEATGLKFIAPNRQQRRALVKARKKK